MCRAKQHRACLLLFACSHAAAHLAANEPAPQALVMFALADWGGTQLPPYTTLGQLAVAQAMGSVAALSGSHPAFVLAAGDNMYMEGLAAPLPDNVTAVRVRETFQNVYTAPGLQVPWYLVAGNHDWVGDVQAEVALNGSLATGGRWNMPATYYTFVQTLQGGETVQFVMVDTETLTGGLNTPPYALATRRLTQSSEGDPGLDSPLDPPVPASWEPPAVDEVQWTWVASTLSSSVADWIIVVGHHPVWSVGSYGPTWPLVERLVPMMEAAGVALYVSGHEHQAEHFRSEPHASGVDYLVIGNGAYYNDTLPEFTEHASVCPAGSLQFQYGAGTAFSLLRITPGNSQAPTQLSGVIYGSGGQQLYSWLKESPRTVKGHTAGNLGSPPGPPSAGGLAMKGARDALLALLAFAACVGALLAASGAAQAHALGPDVAKAARADPRAVRREGLPLLSGAKPRTRGALLVAL